MEMVIHWPLVLFTVCASWAAGLFGAFAVWAWRERIPKSSAPSIIACLIGAGLTAILASFASEGWTDLFGDAGVMNVGIDAMSVIIGVFIVMVVLFFIVLYKRKGDIPVLIMGFSVVIAVLLVFAVSQFYALTSGSAWDTPVWFFVMLGNAAALGTGTVTFITNKQREAIDLENYANIIAAVFNAVASITFLVVLTVVGGQEPATEAVFGGAVAAVSDSPDAITHALLPFSPELMFTSSIIIIGSLLAVLAAYLGRKNGPWLIAGVLVTVCTLLGAFAVNFVAYAVSVSATMF